MLILQICELTEKQSAVQFSGISVQYPVGGARGLQWLPCSVTAQLHHITYSYTHPKIRKKLDMLQISVGLILPEY